MPLYETESLVLKSYNLAEADRIVVFFTREHGLVRGVAKGAKRLKSRFGSTLELFSIVNLSYFQKEDRELVSIQSVELSKSYFAEASDPEFLNTFSYIADLLMAFLPPHDRNETLYRMTKACLEIASDSPERLACIRFYFELWLLRLGGYLPDWSRCSECRLVFAGKVMAGLRSDFQLVCQDCRMTRNSDFISSAHIEVFHSVQKYSPSKFLELTIGIEDTVSEVSGVVRRIISQVIGRDLITEKSFAVNYQQY